MIYSDAETDVHSLFSIQLTDGYVGIQLDGIVLYQFYYILTNDSLWHDISMSMDYTHHYLLLRLDHVFSHILYLSARIAAEKLLGIISGDDFRGCIGNLTFNHQEVFAADGEQRFTPHFSVEDVGTVSGCSSAEMVAAAAKEKDDFCSLYRPCYHGGSCINLGSSFICHCFQSRFTGNQCQYDLQPCDSYPCSINEQCLTLSAEGNRTFLCLSSSAESGSALIRKPLYLGLLMILLTCALSVLVAYCHTKRREQTSLNSPALIEKDLPSSPSSSSSATNSQPVQLLLKLNYNGQPSITTMKVRRRDQVRLGQEEYRADPCDDFVRPADSPSFVHYRTWEGRMA